MHVDNDYVITLSARGGRQKFHTAGLQRDRSCSRDDLMPGAKFASGYIIPVFVNHLVSALFVPLCILYISTLRTGIAS